MAEVAALELALLVVAALGLGRQVGVEVVLLLEILEENEVNWGRIVEIGASLEVLDRVKACLEIVTCEI